MSLFLLGLLAGVFIVLLWQELFGNAPEGYEDETGFHYGKEVEIKKGKVDSDPHPATPKIEVWYCPNCGKKL